MSPRNAIRPSSRDAIVDSALALLAQNPGASISEIALNAGVGRATLHRLFAKKEDLILAIQKQSIAETNQAVLDAIREDMNAAEKLKAMFTAVIPLGDRFHFLSTHEAIDEEVEREYAQELKWVTKLVTELKQEGVVAKDMPDRWAVTQIDQLVWSAWRQVAEGNLAAADAPGLSLKLLTQGFKQ